MGRMVTGAAKAMNSSVVRSSIGSVKMSTCAAKLAAAIADPFSEEAKGACFPLYPAPDSQKIAPFSRVEGAIGTAGVGFIAFNPSVANDVPSFYISGANFTGTRNTILSAASTLSTGVFAGTHNGPYGAAQLIRGSGAPESSLSGRVVAAGIRVFYTGTTLNQSGTITCLQHPTHGTLTGMTAGQAQSFTQSDVQPFTRKSCTLSVAPCAVQEAAYPTGYEASKTRLLYPFGADNVYHTTYEGDATFTSTATVDGNVVGLAAPIALIMVTGVAGSTFHIDYTIHLEYTGSTCAAVSTPNSVDVSSVYAILTAASQLGTRKMASPSSSNWKLLMDGVRSAMGSPVAVSSAGVIKRMSGLAL